MAVARVTRVISSSKKGFQDAVDQAVTRASKTLRGITGGEVVSQKVKVEKGKIAEYRVEMNIIFLLE
ncbi:MAG: dodecin family protein [Candidatus Binatia bacterium]